MKTKALYDQGSASIIEDGMIFRPPFYFGVTDGVSGVYLPEEGPRMFNGMTGGQLASAVVCNAFNGVSPSDYSLKEIFWRANAVIGKEIEGKLSIEETELLPSTTFVVSEITSHKVRIIQGGDSLAIWHMRDGTLGGTLNKMYAYENELLSIIATLMKKHEENRQKMWEEFRPILIKKRQANVNTKQGGFALFNGQLCFERFCQKFILPKEEITLLILFSDGLVPFEKTKTESGLADYVVNLYREGGLQGVLKEGRKIAKEKRSSSHEDYPEATAIAIEF